MRVAYFDCPSGASGNMLLGALLDAGAPLAAVTDAVEALGLTAAAGITVEEVERQGQRAKHVVVDVREPQAWRAVAQIDRLIADAPLDEGVRERSRLAFRLLAQAEAKAHGVSVDDVRLHEAGAVDAVVDVVGTFAAAQALRVEIFYSSALPLSSGGTSAGEHGIIPLPAPATVNILDAVGAPTYEKQTTAELVTPTGAAIIGACAIFESPAVATESEGFGAGTAELDWPNLLHVVIGDLVAAPAMSADGADTDSLSEETVTVIETNIDDMAPNLLAALPRTLLDAGALEAFVTPVVMKKGRAAHLVTVVAPTAIATRLATQLVRETSTLGVRLREERRLVAGRRFESFETSIGELVVKLKLLEGRVVDAVPEFDDVRRLAEARGLPLNEAHRQVSDEARRHFVEPAE